MSNFDVTNTAFNIVGVIEGNDVHLKNEYVILGAHYDHIGINKTEVNGDFINNGANDDASGVTAVAELVKYFGTYKTNKRSILVAFFSPVSVQFLYCLFKFFSKSEMDFF